MKYIEAIGELMCGSFLLGYFFWLGKILWKDSRDFKYRYPFFLATWFIVGAILLVVGVTHK